MTLCTWAFSLTLPSYPSIFLSSHVNFIIYKFLIDSLTILLFNIYCISLIVVGEDDLEAVKEAEIEMTNMTDVQIEIEIGTGTGTGMVEAVDMGQHTQNRLLQQHLLLVR